MLFTLTDYYDTLCINYRGSAMKHFVKFIILLKFNNIGAAGLWNILNNISGLF